VSNLSAGDKRFLYDFFKISGGYILQDMYEKARKNKTFTRNLILDAAGIDIYANDNEMYGLSQAKCVDKLIADFPNLTVAKFFKELRSFFIENTCNSWNYCDNCENEKQCKRLSEILKKLESQPDIVVPVLRGQNVSEVYEDLVRNIEMGKYTLAVDRLHTYSIYFFERLCINNNITVSRDSKGQITVTLEKLITDLKASYIAHGYINTDFVKLATRRIQELMQEYGRVRNDKSAAHPNDLLEKIEAEFVVKTVCNMLEFFKKIDDRIDNKIENSIADDELPF